MRAMFDIPVRLKRRRATTIVERRINTVIGLRAILMVFFSF